MGNVRFASQFFPYPDGMWEGKVKAVADDTIHVHTREGQRIEVVASPSQNRGVGDSIQGSWVRHPDGSRVPVVRRQAVGEAVAVWLRQHLIDEWNSGEGLDFAPDGWAASLPIDTFETTEPEQQAWGWGFFVRGSLSTGETSQAWVAVRSEGAVDKGGAWEVSVVSRTGCNVAQWFLDRRGNIKREEEWRKTVQSVLEKRLRDSDEVRLT